MCEVFVKGRGEDRIAIDRQIFMVYGASKSRGEKEGLCIASTVQTGGSRALAHMQLLS